MKNADKIARMNLYTTVRPLMQDLGTAWNAEFARLHNAKRWDDVPIAVFEMLAHVVETQATADAAWVAAGLPEGGWVGALAR